MLCFRQKLCKTCTCCIILVLACSYANARSISYGLLCTIRLSPRQNAILMSGFGISHMVFVSLIFSWYLCKNLFKELRFEESIFLVKKIIEILSLSF